jgi:hypothetical protein
MHINALGRNVLDKRSACLKRFLLATTHNTRNREIPMPPAGFKPANPKIEPPKPQAVERAATGIGQNNLIEQADFLFICRNFRRRKHERRQIFCHVCLSVCPKSVGFTLTFFLKLYPGDFSGNCRAQF